MPKSKDEAVFFLANKDIDGELYGYLQSISKTYGDGNNYIVKKEMPPQTVICSIVGIKSAKTLKSRFEKLLKTRYLEEKEDIYILPRADLIDGTYVAIPIKTLEAMLNVFKENVIKVYILLAALWNSKTKDKTFTYKFITEHLGISNKTKGKVDEIRQILRVLKKVGLIDYVEFTEVKNNLVIPRMRLTAIDKNWNEITQ